MPAVTRKKTRRGGANGEEEDVERMPNNITLQCKSGYKTGEGKDISWKNYLTLANTSRAHAGFEDFSIKEITKSGILYLIQDAYPNYFKKLNTSNYFDVSKSIIEGIEPPLQATVPDKLVSKMHQAIEDFFNELQSTGNDVSRFLNKKERERHLNKKYQKNMQDYNELAQREREKLQQQAKESFEISMPDGWPVMLDLYFFYKQDPRYREISKNLLRVYQMTDYLKYNQNLDYSLTNAMREKANQNLFDEMLNDKCLESYTFTTYIPNGNAINAIKKKCREKYLVDHIVKPAYTKDTPIFKEYLEQAINKIFYNKLF